MTLNLIWLLVAFCAGAAIAVGFTLSIARPAGGRKSIEQLKETHENYRDDVATHFVDTAKLVNEMTDSYKALFDHLQTGAEQLLDESTLREKLTADAEEIITLSRLGHRQTGGAATAAAAAAAVATEADASQPSEQPEPEAVAEEGTAETDEPAAQADEVTAEADVSEPEQTEEIAAEQDDLTEPETEAEQEELTELDTAAEQDDATEQGDTVEQPIEAVAEGSASEADATSEEIAEAESDAEITEVNETESAEEEREARPA